MHKKHLKSSFRLQLVKLGAKTKKLFVLLTSHDIMFHTDNNSSSLLKISGGLFTCDVINSVWCFHATTHLTWTADYVFTVFNESVVIFWSHLLWKEEKHVTHLHLRHDGGQKRSQKTMKFKPSADSSHSVWFQPLYSDWGVWALRLITIRILGSL